MKKSAVLFLFFYSILPLIGQNSYADSLISLIDKTEGLKKASLLSEISVELRFTEPEKALKYANEALVEARLAGDSIEVGNSLNCIGIANHIQGNYDIALSNYLKALTAFESKKALKGIGSSNLNIGIVYADQGKLDLSLTYYKKALAIYEMEKGNERSIANAVNNIATVYSSQRKFPEALDYQYKALKIRKELNDSSGIATSLGNIGIIYFGMQQTEKALPYYLQSLEIGRKLGNLRSVALSLSNIGEVYYQLKDYDNAIKVSEECIEISEKIDLKPQLKQAYYVLSELYKFKRNFEKALEYQELYANIKDSIFSEESAQSIAEMQTKYDSEKKETENNLLKQESEIKNLQLSKNKTWFIILFLGIGLIVIIAFLLYNRYRIKKKDNELLELKNAEITLQKKEITDSINYAKKIQNAILPHESLVKKLLPESFILYKPKDIVSGDFFWIEQKGDAILFSTVDCTGHGVPGAMMSVLGFSLLSQAVNEKGLTNPADILKHLDIGINQSLRKTTEENSMKDGMDLSICSLNTKTLELQYAGAYNPLWVIKNSTKELIEIKADKKPIGANTEGEAGQYKNNSLQLQSGDCIYVFTDGFADQFGGVKGKKFMSRPMKELLISICNKPMQNQLNILENTICTWQGEHEQVDDILIIGVRV
jgi:serine phosphatase RsbU (regulator of sigma subunit)